MTSEIGLLNKQCVALAADSAMTVTYLEKGESKRRYFKGTNKIFNLSAVHPVGAMIYASADLQGVPWEIIVKAYRDHTKGKSHDELSGYAADFFDYVVSNGHLFPSDQQQEQFKKQVDLVAAINIVRPILNLDAYKKETDPAAKVAVFESYFATQKQLVEDDELLPGAAKLEPEAIATRFAAEIQAMLEADEWYKDVPRTVMADLARIAILGLFKINFTNLQRTGLTFAGYGDKEYFPRMEVYECHGMVLGKLVCEQKSKIAIDQMNSSELQPLAQSEMIETFIWGINGRGYATILQEYKASVKSMLDELTRAQHLQSVATDSFLENAEREFGKKVLKAFADSHQVPLRRVVASLPPNELAELAETMVFMESLKERVTSPAESVSGPIDVAVISKGDGFIWIKRKHYFDAKLNPRYFVRSSMGGKEQ